ncbi:MAG: hypothetical protein RIC55_09400 [Pirellulaceae bacterium]
MNRAIVYFGSDLSQDQFRDAETRRQRLEAGLELVRSVPDVEVKSCLRAACAVVVELSELSTEQLRSVLELAGLGDLSVDDPSRPKFKAAN